MEILKVSQTDKLEIINKAVDVLSRGGTVIYPTETTYGIGVDPTNLDAVNKLLTYKRKREGTPISIAVSDIKMAETYVDLNDTAKNIYRNFLPGPVTVISKSKGKVIPLIESEKKTLGIRIPDYSLVIDIIRSLNKPITTTSATASYAKRPYKIEDILENVSQKQKDLIDLIIDAGELPHNNPSSVIDTVSGEIETVRIGTQRFNLKNNIQSESVENTVKFGENLGKFLKTRLQDGFDLPTVIAIQGDLGAGKTHFASGVAKGLEIKDLVKSPTFILSNEFEFFVNDKNLTFYHIDTYRMESENELIEIGYEKMISNPNIILIEWADKVIPVLDIYKDKVDFIWLKFEHLNEVQRKISFEKEGLF